MFGRRGLVAPGLVQVLVLVSLCHGVLSISDIGRLTADILRDYNPDVRPVRHYRNSTVVWLDVYPNHLTHLDENRGILTMEANIYMCWKDDFLTWNPDEYGGLREVRIDEHKLWKPDIAVFPRHGSADSSWYPTWLIANYTGHVVWTSTGTLEVICGHLDYSGYPRDTKRCEMNIGSWTCNMNDVDFYATEWNMTEHEDTPTNTNWHIAKTSFIREEVMYPEFDPVPYAELIFVLELERQGSPAALLNGIPCAGARLLVLFVFLAEGPILKFLFACASVVAHMILASIVLRHIPVPALAFLALSRVTSGLALCVAAVAVQLVVGALAQSKSQPPAFLRRLKQVITCRPDDPAPDPRQEETGKKARDDWLFLAALLNKCSCIVFCFLLVFV